MILALSAIFVGAVTQRIAGMGFAMMVAPFVVLALGPSEGVVLVNSCGALVAAITMVSLRRDIDWSKFGWLTVSSIVGVVVGGLVVRSLDVSLFQVLVGSVLIVAVVASVLVARTSLRVHGRRWTVAAGGTTGALVAAAGIGGPPMTIYAVLSRWQQKSFAATMQPYQAAVSLVAVAGALIADPSSWPTLTGVTWLAVAASIVAGLLGGYLLSRVVTPSAGRVVVIALALIGAVITVVDGIAGLLG